MALPEESMTMRTYRYFVCPNKHQGEEKTSENDQPFSGKWEDADVTDMRGIGKDNLGYKMYICVQCGESMTVTTRPTR